jgi:hypothetical protein
MKLPPAQRYVRVALKRLLYSQLYQREVVRVGFGRAKPLLPFRVEAAPPSVYFNFEIDAQRASGLENELDLPFPLAPIRCLEDDAPFYCLTLNLYKVSGLANGIRAEWSVYIQDAGGTPRYLVVEAVSDSGSLDSVDLFTRGGDVTHSAKRGTIRSSVRAADGGRFTATCRTTAKDKVVRAAPEWIAANDYIYWMNGICDRTFYDSGLANANTSLVKATNLKLRDSTRWGGLVIPEPRHVVVFHNAIDFAISPWWNLDDPCPRRWQGEE